MNLQVHLICPACRSERTVLIAGGWDLKNVQHDCSDHPDHPAGRWVITFDPPRSIY